MHLFRYTPLMVDIAPILNVRFFRTDAGNEPVREWLTDLLASIDG